MRKLLLIVLSFCFLLGMAIKAEVEGVKGEVIEDSATVEVNAEKGYKIQVSGEGAQGDEKEINFISPDGNMIKSIPYATWEDRARITISPDNHYLIESSVLSSGLKGKNPRIEISFVNAKAEKKWSKSFEIEYMLSQTDEDDQMPYFFKVSRDGSTIAFIRSRNTYEKDWWSDIVVFDTLGNKITSVSHVPPQMEGSSSDFEISPDGKIIGAIVFPQSEDRAKRGRHFFFLDVESGRTKVVKAEGKGWAVDFALPYEMGTPLGKIYIGWGIYEDPENKKWLKGGYKYLTFNEIPSDISNLFGDKK